VTPTIASIAITIALLTGDGLGIADSVPAAGSEAGGIVPTVDVPAPLDSGAGDGIRRGGQATRIEFDDPDLNAEISAWYRLAYLDGGSRLQVFEHSAPGVYGPESVIVKSELAAWRVANEAVGANGVDSVIPALPNWAVVRTGITDGPSAGLIFTLAYIDVLTRGALAGNLRVAGTGGISPNGFVFSVAGVEVKVATAVLARPDVVFSPRPSKLIRNTTVIESGSSGTPELGDTVGDWLDIDGYEQAGRDAAGHPGTVAFVVVHDFRQALAWLCGRTGIPTTCGVSHRLADVAIAIARP
jgi:hypothetical protein